jgi:putative ABC transport system ATP-binding protein
LAFLAKRGEDAAMSLLEFHNVQRVFAAGSGAPARAVLDGVDFALEAGRTMALVGPSGAGKTTLLYLAAGLCRATGGSVHFDGRDLARMPPAELTALRRSRIGMVFQNNLCLSALPAWENVALPLLLEGARMGEARRQALEWLDAVELAPFADAPTAALSGGQRRRLGLARALGMRLDLLLADEPTADLDEATALRIEDLLFGWLAERGCAALIVTHEAPIERRVDEVRRLSGGKLEPARPASVD